MRIRKLTCLTIFSLLLSLCLCSCHKENDPEVSFKGCKDIAELASIECYYHNVAEIKNDGTNYLFGLLNVGYKKAWFEYRGSVKLGIDASEVAVSGPDEAGVVTVTLPEVTVIGQPDVDDDSITELVSDTGLLTSISGDEQVAALAYAQANMLEVAQQDEALKRQAHERACILLEQYIVSVGDAVGAEYTVRFEGPDA